MKIIDATDAELRPITEPFDLGSPVAGGWESVGNHRTYRLTTERGRYAIRNLGYTGEDGRISREYTAADYAIAWVERLNDVSDVAARPVRTTDGKAIHVYAESTAHVFESRLGWPVVLSVHEWLDGGPPELQTPRQARTAGRAVGECLAKVHQFSWEAEGFIEDEPEPAIDWATFEQAARDQPGEFGRRSLAVMPALRRLEDAVLEGSARTIGCTLHGDVQQPNVIMEPNTNYARLIDFDPAFMTDGSPVHELGRLSHEFAKVGNRFEWVSPQVESTFATAAVEGYVKALTVQVDKAGFVQAVTYEAAKRLNDRIHLGPRLAEAALTRCAAGLALAAKLDPSLRPNLPPPPTGIGF